MNLSQAVNIMAYECWNRKLEIQSSNNSNNNDNEVDNNDNNMIKDKDKQATKAELYFFLNRIESLINSDHNNNKVENYSNKDIININTIFQRVYLYIYNICIYLLTLQY